MVVRVWGDRLAGAAAVVLFHLVPLPYIVIGNANLTYAFGGSVATATMVAATLLPLRSRDVLQLAVLFLLASLAFLSHVGVFPLLLAALVASAVLYRWRGGATLRAPSRAVFLAAMLAAVFSVVVVLRTVRRGVRDAEPRARARCDTAPGAGVRPRYRTRGQTRYR